MKLVRDLFAIVGLVCVLGGAFLYVKLSAATREFDPGAFDIYRTFVTQLLETKDPAQAMVWTVPVDEGIEVEDVKESLKSLAVQHNFLFVGESPFHKQAEAVTGRPHRHIAFMNFCDVRVGIKMADYNDAYTAFMPCNIAVVEGQDGKLWLYALNMDFLIHGAKELPTELKKDALRVRQTMRQIMEGAARGEF